MIDSRDIDYLYPSVAAACRRHIDACAAAGIKTLITSTYRDHATQDALYAQGRTKPGRKVTNARGGQSWHNYRLAYDIYPLVNGKPVWGATKPDEIALWTKVGELGEAQGLEWAGRWKTFREFPHFQMRYGLTLDRVQKVVATHRDILAVSESTLRSFANYA